MAVLSSPAAGQIWFQSRFSGDCCSGATYRARRCRPEPVTDQARRTSVTKLTRSAHPTDPTHPSDSTPFHGRQPSAAAAVQTSTVYSTVTVTRVALGASFPTTSSADQVCFGQSRLQFIPLDLYCVPVVVLEPEYRYLSRIRPEQQIIFFVSDCRFKLGNFRARSSKKCSGEYSWARRRKATVTVTHQQSIDSGRGSCRRDRPGQLGASYHCCLLDPPGAPSSLIGFNNSAELRSSPMQ